jgi:hypothetical protein
MKSNQTDQRRRFASYAMTLIAVSALFLGASPFASAQEGKSGLMIEPSVSYELGNTSIGYPAPFSNSTGTASGFGLGARLGFHFEEAFFLGLDPAGSNFDVNFQNSNSLGRLVRARH